jgi:hypothetical protein
MHHGAEPSFFFSLCTCYSRKAFWCSWASGIPVTSENQPDPLSVDAHSGPILPHAGQTDNCFKIPATVELLLCENGIKPFSQLKKQDNIVPFRLEDILLFCFPCKDSLHIQGSVPLG